MKLICPGCGRSIPGADIDLGKGVGVCRPCGEIVPVTAQLAKTFRPADLQFRERLEDGHYVATIPPRPLAAVPQAFFCLIWDGFMAVWYALAIINHVWAMAAFGLLHLGVGIVLTHQTLVALTNTRVMKLGAGRFQFSSGPIPFAGNLNVPVDEVDSFAVISRAGRGGPSYYLGVNVAGVAHKLNVGTSSEDATQYVVTSLTDALERTRAGRPALPGAPYRGA